MNRKHLRLLLGFMCLMSMPLFGMTKAESQYRDAYQTEKMGLYAKAREKYYGVCDELINKKQTLSTANLTETLPILLSAATRLGIVTSKTCFYDVHPLGYQLDMFRDADAMLEEVLLRATQLHDDFPNLIPKQTYSMLFFAKAYNRIGWSSKLVFAIPWKQYVVHPPTDCILILYSAADDLNFMKDIEDVSDPEKANVVWAQRLKKLEKGSLEFRTYQLTNLENDPDVLAGIFTKRYQQNVFPTLSYIHSQNVIDALDEARKNTTYQDILARKNSPLFDVFSEVPRKIGIN